MGPCDFLGYAHLQGAGLHAAFASNARVACIAMLGETQVFDQPFHLWQPLWTTLKNFSFKRIFVFHGTGFIGYMVSYEVKYE